MGASGGTTKSSKGDLTHPPGEKKKRQPDPELRTEERFLGGGKKNHLTATDRNPVTGKNKVVLVWET